MKPRFRPPPSREELLAIPLHMIVRDFPETLARFRIHGLSLQEWGARRLSDLEEPAGVLDDLEASTAWRVRPKSG